MAYNYVSHLIPSLNLSSQLILHPVELEGSLRKCNNIPRFSFDLFSEMVMVGQMLNYDHFYSAPITELLLLWQHPSGCYVDEDMLPNEVLDKTE